MKKVIYCLLVICLSLTLLPLQSAAATTDKPTSLPVAKPLEPVESSEVKAMLKRVDELSTLDKTTLRSPDKKNTKAELTAVQRHHSVGYISVGALVLIILLVVILL